MADPRPAVTPTRAAGAVAAATLAGAFLLPDAVSLRFLAGLPAGVAAALVAAPDDRSAAVVGSLAGTAAGLVAAYAGFAALELLAGTSPFVVAVAPVVFFQTAFTALVGAGLTAAAVHYLRHGSLTSRTEAEAEAEAPADAAESETPAGWTPPETDADLETLVRRAHSAPDPAVAEHLAAYLTHPERATRRRAARALTAVPGPDLIASGETVRTLVGGLDDGLVIRQYALRALAAAADADPAAVAGPAAEPVADCLDDYNVWVRRAAAETLANLSRVEPAVAGLVRPALSADRIGTRAAAARVLIAAADHQPDSARPAAADLRGLLGGNTLDARRAVDALASLAESAPEAVASAVPDLLPYLDDDRTRADALRALAAVADRVPEALVEAGALPRLVEALLAGGRPGDDGDETARDAHLAATAVLAALDGEAAAREVLSPALAGRDYWERKQAADALAAAADASDEAALRVLLDDPNVFVRRRIAEAIIEARGVALK